MKKIDIASIFMGLSTVILLFSKHFMFFSESRVDSKNGLTAVESLGANFPILLGITLIVFVLIIIKKTSPLLNYITGMIASFAIGFSVLFAGQATNVISNEAANGRISMSLGIYAYILLMYLIIEKCNIFIVKNWQKYTTALPAILIMIISLATGQLDGLSIMQEYYSRTGQFYDELAKHVTMSLSVIFVSIIIGIPLGWWAYKNKKVGSFITTFLSIIQSIPSIAFIFLMMFPLAFINNNVPGAEELGITGIGAAPVFVALVLYALFQIVNNVYGALSSIDKHYIEVAEGMGMSSNQIFWKVELPNAIPVILSGIRLATIVTISGTTLGAYAGFGGLGTFIIAGSSGFAIDLILLGTFPIIFMIIITNYLIIFINRIMVAISSYRGSVTV